MHFRGYCDGRGVVNAGRRAEENTAVVQLKSDQGPEPTPNPRWWGRREVGKHEKNAGGRMMALDRSRKQGE